MPLETQMRRRLLPEAENMLKVNDSLYYYKLGDGFSTINFSQLTRNMKAFTLPEPKLTFFRDEENLHPIDAAKSFTITHKKSRDITIQFAAPGMAQPRYVYRLAGPKNQQFYQDRGTVNFQNLPYGDYELEVTTAGMGNKSSTPLKITFEIDPPWYWSVTSKIGYFLLLLAIVFGIRKYNRSKLSRKQNELKQRMLKQQEETFLALEKEKMAKEVRTKQKELTSTAMNVAKKNQLILELKNMLLVNKDKFTNQQRYKSFITKLDHSINDDEDWRSFEINFKELHEDFFEILLEKYKGLTPKDLKLCAYLKMNLSSKEIAPLMGITTRGVEIHRYRLRKKLNIDGSENISNFLITLK
jgi:DNA-binding CsgD family transcriptional regulator